MDIFFSRKKRYVTNSSYDSVRADIESIVDRRWYDFSENITGKLNSDGSFEFSPKWTFGAVRVFGIPQSMAYLTGTLTEDNGRTVIETTSRPNYTIVAAFYCMVFLLVARLLGIEIFIMVTLTEMLLVFPILCVVLAGVMVFGALRLRLRFERLLQLRRDD